MSIAEIAYQYRSGSSVDEISRKKNLKKEDINAMVDFVNGLSPFGGIDTEYLKKRVSKKKTR